MRTIGVVTTARADYGIYLPVLRQIRADPDLGLHLMVTGMHLSPEFGLTVRDIQADGFHIGERIETLLSSDTPEGVAKSMGLGTLGFAQAYARFRPDLLLVLGDRFEMHAAVVASLPFKIPVAHIHGGESTQGAIDEAMRHSITKMSHLHFVAAESYARRVIQMGEETWRVMVSGAPALDNLRFFSLPSQEELDREYGLDPADPFLLVTFHPVTLEYEETEHHVTELLSALDQVDYPLVITYPNADTCGRRIIQMIKEFGAGHTKVLLIDNLGTQGYMSMMSHARAMVGNSSSGIIEAASFRLPVVNIGSRQDGRLRAPNVIDVGYSRSEVLAGIQQAVSSHFGSGLAGLTNPHGDGHAAERIVDVLKATPIDDRLMLKRFHDLPLAADASAYHPVTAAAPSGSQAI